MICPKCKGDKVTIRTKGSFGLSEWNVSFAWECLQCGNLWNEKQSTKSTKHKREEKEMNKKRVLVALCTPNGTGIEWAGLRKCYTVEEAIKAVKRFFGEEK